MRYNKRKANLGKPLENPRMEARARKLRVGNLVRFVDKRRSNEDWVANQLRGQNGIVVHTRPYGWDYLVQFPRTSRRGGIFAFWDFDLELVKR